MLPLRDTVRARGFPWLNWLIIIINVVVFLFEAALPHRSLLALTRTYGMVPARLFSDFGLAQGFTLLSSMFLHGGWWHLISNMWVLFIFGDNVEDRMGHGRYLLFYLICGVAAALAHALVSPSSRVPTVGASGAISGVMGAYLVLFPRARVLTLMPIWILMRLVELPALLFIGFWFVSQLFNGLFALATDVGTYGGVAWWAHVGGFVAGLVLVKLFERRVSFTVYPGENGWW